MRYSILILFVTTGCNIFSPSDPVENFPDTTADIITNEDVGKDVTTMDAKRDLSTDTEDLAIDVAMDVGDDMLVFPCGAEDVVVEPGLSIRSIGSEDTLWDGTLYRTEGSNIACAVPDLPSNVGEGDGILTDTGVVFIYQKIDDGTVALHETAEQTLVETGSAARAFLTIPAWVAATDGNLIAEARNEVGVLYDDSVFSDTNQITGSATNVNYHRTLRAAVPHNGRAGIGVVIAPATANHGIQIIEDFFELRGVEITNWSFGSTGSLDGINVLARGVVIDSVIIHDDGALMEVNPDANGINVEIDFGSAVVTNSFVYNISRGGILIHSKADATVTVRNSTVFRVGLNDNSPASYPCVGISGSENDVIGSQAVIENVLAGSCGGDAFRAQVNGVLSGDFNASDDLLGLGANSVMVTLANEVLSTTVGLENLHLRPNSQLIDVGTDLLIAHDIDGDVRPAGNGVDIGADEVAP